MQTTTVAGRIIFQRMLFASGYNTVRCGPSLAALLLCGVTARHSASSVHLRTSAHSPVPTVDSPPPILPAHEKPTYQILDEKSFQIGNIAEISGTDEHQLPLNLHRALSPPQERARSLQSLDLACPTLGGSFDESGQCIVCLGINCFIMGEDLRAETDEFCTSTKYPAFDEVQYCGTAFCYLDVLTIKCEASIPMLDHLLNGSATCSIGLECDCVEITWDGGKCSSCSGAADGYDCSNVGGPVKFQELPAVVNLLRNYRHNWFFQQAVNWKTMPQASRAAGVPIGGAVDDDSWDLLRNYVPTDYTSITPENAMKWNSLLESVDTLGVYNFTNADRYIDFAQTAGVHIRGHVMIWGAFKEQSYPMAVTALVEASDDPKATLIEIMREHIHTVALHFGEKVACWDVVNEHFISRNDNNIFFRTLGDDYVKIAFECAREALPRTPLVWNEVFNDFSLSNQRVSDWLALLRQYKAEGVPIDRIGVQGHIYNTLHDIDNLRKFFGIVAGLGFGVEVTEYDAPISAFVDQSDFLQNLININGPFQAQADYTASYLKACLDCGRCEGFTFWGLSDAFSWLDWLVFPNQAPNLPLLIDEEGYRKPVWLSVRKTLESFTTPPTIFDVLFEGIWSLFSSIWNGLSNILGFIGVL